MTVESARTGTDVARWLLPLLKEYTDKLSAACDRLEQLAQTSMSVALIPARALAMRAAFQEFLLDYARQASSLLDHYQFDGEEELKLELANRWQEAEMAIRVSDLLGINFNRVIVQHKDRSPEVRKLVEHIKSGGLLD